jgi:hypothetical protein
MEQKVSSLNPVKGWPFPPTIFLFSSLLGTVVKKTVPSNEEAVHITVPQKDCCI